MRRGTATGVRAPRRVVRAGPGTWCAPESATRRIARLRASTRSNRRRPSPGECVPRRDEDLIALLGTASGGAEQLGGKGASLDKLGKLGFRVPPGFCLTTAAFRAQIASGTPAPDLATAPLA